MKLNVWHCECVRAKSNLNQTKPWPQPKTAKWGTLSQNIQPPTQKQIVGGNLQIFFSLVGFDEKETALRCTQVGGSIKKPLDLSQGLVFYKCGVDGVAGYLLFRRCLRACFPKRCQEQNICSVSFQNTQKKEHAQHGDMLCLKTKV